MFKKIRSCFWEVFDAFASLLGFLSVPATATHFQCNNCGAQGMIYYSPSDSNGHCAIHIAGCECPPRSLIL